MTDSSRLDSCVRAIADAEIHRLAAPEQRGIGRLVSSGEFVDRAGVAAERKEPPLLPIAISERNAGIIKDVLVKMAATPALARVAAGTPSSADR